MIAVKFHIESMPADVSWQTFSYGTDARYMPTGIDYASKCDTNDTLRTKAVSESPALTVVTSLAGQTNTDKLINTFSY